MEQLIIFLLFIVGSIISSVIQHKKKKAEEQQQRELEELTGTPRGAAAAPRKPETSWPQTAGDWQEQLRRMLEGDAPPPVIKPVLLPPQQKPPSQQKPQQPRSSKPSPPPLRTEVAKGDIALHSPLKESPQRSNRASNLHENVQKRMRAIRDKTSVPAQTAFNRARPKLQSDVVRRLRRSRTSIREAFIASLIFSPPKAVESSEVESAR